MKNIKNYTLLLFLSLVMITICSCKKNNGFRDPISTDKTKPPVVTNVKVTNFNGGSYITYDVPNNDNLLYVLAEYNIRDKVARQTKSSYYTDTIAVEGFAKEQDYNVTLYSVSRAEVKSDPITVKVHPQTPIFTQVRQTTSIAADFGGVNVQAANPLKRDIGVIITVFNKSTNTMEIQDQHYTNEAVINYSIRGFNTDTRDFGVYITDNFGNISDTLKKSISPLFEALLNKSLFSTYQLPSDSEIGYGWVLPNLWDGKTDNNSSGWHTNPGPLPPYVGTFNIGNTYRLSRFVLYERPTMDFAYQRGNPSDFAIWGSNAAHPADVVLPITAPVGTVLGDWVNINNYHFPDPPSGLPIGFTNAADEAFVAAGVSFNIPVNAPPVHFIRIAVSRTWGQTNFSHIMEISLYGKAE